MKPDWEVQMATLAAGPSRVTRSTACLRERTPVSRISTRHGVSCAGVKHRTAIGPGNTLRWRLRLPLCKMKSIRLRRFSRNCRGTALQTSHEFVYALDSLVELFQRCPV